MDNAQAVINEWPEEAKEAAKLVLDTYGQPAEASASMLVWYNAGPWKRVIAYKDFDHHNFPAPHTDSVESFIDYNVPPEKVSGLAAFDGSVVVNRTRGEISARCHDEQANFLALNLAHDMVTGIKDVEQARSYYADEFLAYRRKQPTPYMEKLTFQPSGKPDPDEPIISDQELHAAIEEGKSSA